MGNAAHSTYNSTALGIERAAVELWPLLTGSDNSRQRSEYAAALADILGAPKEFHRYITGSPGELAERQTRLLAVFRDNVALLLGKTWVESHDDKGRDSALSLLDSLLTAYNNGEWALCMRRFITLTADLAWLLFGESVEDPLFMDYLYRIDSKLGLLYWYAAKLKDQPAPAPELAKLQLLVGMYALASF